MKAFVDKLESDLRRTFHIKLRKYGLGDDIKALILESFGVESTKELNNRELIQVIDSLDKDYDADYAAMDKLRKQVMAAIGAYLRVMDMKEDSRYIKGMACRAASKKGDIKYKNFNDIPKSKLRGIYNEFVKQRKAIEGTREELTIDN
jgi:hypothetical protein